MFITLLDGHSFVAVVEYAGIWLGYANIFIATFIMIYAYLFLKQTNEHKDRRPWDFLFISSVLYFIYQIFNIMWLSGITTFFNQNFDTDLVRNTFAFLYSGGILLAFISQYDLILRSQLILISKKDKYGLEAEQDVAVKTGVGDTEDKTDKIEKKISRKKKVY